MRYQIALLAKLKTLLIPLFGCSFKQCFVFSFALSTSVGSPSHLRGFGLVAAVVWVVDKTNKPSLPEDVKITEGTLFSALILCNFPSDFCISCKFHKSFSIHFAQIFSSKDLLRCATAKSEILSFQSRRGSISAATPTVNLITLWMPFSFLNSWSRIWSTSSSPHMDTLY